MLMMVRVEFVGNVTCLFCFFSHIGKCYEQHKHFPRWYDIENMQI